MPIHLTKLVNKQRLAVLDTPLPLENNQLHSAHVQTNLPKASSKQAGMQWSTPQKRFVACVGKHNKSIFGPILMVSIWWVCTVDMLGGLRTSWCSAKTRLVFFPGGSPPWCRIWMDLIHQQGHSGLLLRIGNTWPVGLCSLCINCNMYVI